MNPVDTASKPISAPRSETGSGITGSVRRFPDKVGTADQQAGGMGVGGRARGGFGRVAHRRGGSGHVPAAAPNAARDGPGHHESKLRGPVICRLRNATLAFVVLGGVLGTTLGMAGGLVRKSTRAGTRAAAVGALLGSLMGTGVSLVLLPVYFRALDVARRSCRET